MVFRRDLFLLELGCDFWNLDVDVDPVRRVMEMCQMSAGTTKEMRAALV
jgi:hypothetical protein